MYIFKRKVEPITRLNLEKREGGGENGTSRGNRSFSKLYIVCKLVLL